jgi:hypothetical protein
MRRIWPYQRGDDTFQCRAANGTPGDRTQNRGHNWVNTRRPGGRRARAVGIGPGILGGRTEEAPG